MLEMLTLDALRFSIRQENLENQHNCLACDSNATSGISSCEINGLKIFETSMCESCAHVYRSLKPNEDWFNAQFAIRHQSQLNAGISPLSEEIEKERLERYRAIAQFAKKRFPEMKSYLDVGCGPATGFKAFEELGIASTGVEPDTSRAVIAKQNGHDVREVQFQDFESSVSYDLISMVHSLEHFQQPLDFLKRAKNFAHANTLLYIEVPEVLDHVKDWNDSLYLAHMSNFCEKSLRILASRAGWGEAELVHPYAETRLHQGHLCMIFRLEENAQSTLDFDAESSDKFRELKKMIQKRYITGLSLPNFKQHTFELPYLNDLSLGFKGSKQLKAKVHDNYARRQLSKIKDNRFILSESDSF